MFSIAYQLCPVILECLKGRHSELINGQMALENMFKRFFDNLDKLPTILKIMCILHRAMQDEDISKWVAEGLKQDEHLIFQCTRQYVSEGNEIIFVLNYDNIRIKAATVRARTLPRLYKVLAKLYPA
jgi:hypothetical protein